MKFLLLPGALGDSGFRLVEAKVGRIVAKLLLQAQSVYASNRTAAPVSWLTGAHRLSMPSDDGGQAWCWWCYFPVSSSTFFTMAPIPSWMWWSSVSHMKAGVVTTLFFWST